MGAKRDTRDVIYVLFCKATGMEPPANKSAAAGLWWKPISEMADLADNNPQHADWLMRQALKQASGLTLKSPKSIMTMYKNAAARYSFRDTGSDSWSPLGTDDEYPDTDTWSPL